MTPPAPRAPAAAADLPSDRGPQATAPTHHARGAAGDADRRRRAEGARSLSQVHKWWSSKIGPLLAVAYLALLIAPRPLAEGAPRLALLLLSACLLATSAYVINDWFDREVDRRIGKTSTVMRWGARKVTALVLVLIAAGVLPWLLLGLPAAAWVALAAIVLLPLVYSAPPVRWKERGGLGLVADAGLAHVAPTAFALGCFGAFDGSRRPPELVLAALTVVWSGAYGLRAIVGHERVDVENDRAAGVETWALRVGDERAVRLAGRVLLPVEVLALAGAEVALWFVAPVPAAVFVVIAAAPLLARRTGAWTRRLVVIPEREEDGGVLYQFYALWPGLVLLGGVVASDPAYLAVVAVHLALFWPVASVEVPNAWLIGVDTFRRLELVAFFRYRLWGFVSHRVPNWFRYTLWGRVGGWFRYTAWGFVSHRVPNWFRYTLWAFLAHRVPNFFRYTAWGFLRYTVWGFLTHRVPNWFRHSLWVWVSHTTPNWFRHRWPAHRRALGDEVRRIRTDLAQRRQAARRRVHLHLRRLVRGRRTEGSPRAACTTVPAASGTAHGRGESSTTDGSGQGQAALRRQVRR